MTSSCSLFCLCSGVSFHAELSPPDALGPLAPLPVLKPRARILVGSIRAARSSCSGGIIIQSSLRSFSGATGDAALAAWPMLSSSSRFLSVPTGGSEGPNPSSSSLSDSCAADAGSAGLSSRGAGGSAGPIVRLRFSPSVGLGERFAPEAVMGASSSASSCCLFLFASRCGGSAGPMPDIVFGVWRLLRSSSVKRCLWTVEARAAEEPKAAVLDRSIRGRQSSISTLRILDTINTLYNLESSAGGEIVH